MWLTYHLKSPFDRLSSVMIISYRWLIVLSIRPVKYIMPPSGRRMRILRIFRVSDISLNSYVNDNRSKPLKEWKIKEKSIAQILTLDSPAIILRSKIKINRGPTRIKFHLTFKNRMDNIVLLWDTWKHQFRLSESKSWLKGIIRDANQYIKPLSQLTRIYKYGIQRLS